MTKIIVFAYSWLSHIDENSHICEPCGMDGIIVAIHEDMGLGIECTLRIGLSALWQQGMTGQFWSRI